MLEIHLLIALRIGVKQHLAIGFPAFILDAALFIDQIEHMVDPLFGVIIPRRKDQQMRAFGHLRLIPGDLADLGAHFRIGDDDDFKGLKTAGGGRQPRCLDNALNLVFGHRLGRVHFLGGITPVKFFDKHVRFPGRTSPPCPLTAGWALRFVARLT